MDIAVTPRVSILDPDFDRRVIEVARTLLDDIPACRSATYRMQWIGVPGVTGFPRLLLSFPLQAIADDDEQTRVMAVGLDLVDAATKGSLNPWKLRESLRRSVEHFLRHNGMWVGETPDAVFGGPNDGVKHEVIA